MKLSVTQYASMHNGDVGNVRRYIKAGRIPAEKIGNQWVIDDSVPWPTDNRVKSGAYRNWRKKSSDSAPSESSDSD